MLQHGEYSAWVTIDGNVAKVYQPTYDHVNKSVTCWIPSEAGRKFAVNWKSARRDVSLQGLVVIDGVECETRVILDAPRYPNRPNSVGVSYARTSDYTRRDFMFSAIQVTGSDEYLHTIDSSYQFGVIRLELWLLHVLDVTTKPLPHQHRPVLEGQVIHERSKKAGVHHVKYGDEYISPQPTVDLVQGHRLHDKPFLSFTFHYRPLSMLMANGIVPRSMPRSLEEERRAEEIRALEERLAALRSQTSSPTVPPRKTARQNKPLIKSEPEVIDLTFL